MEISLALIIWQISGLCVSLLAYWILASFFVNFFISLLWCICGSFFATNYKIDFVKNAGDKKDSNSEFEDNILLTAQNILIDEMEEQNYQNWDNSEPQIKCRNVVRYDEKPRDEEIFNDKKNEECKINKKNGGLRNSLKKVIIVQIISYFGLLVIGQCWTQGRSSTAVAEDLRPTATATVAEV
jgi:hypothetical protein